MLGLVKGKRWLLLSRVHLDSQKQQLLNELFRLNRKMMKAYLLKESLDRLWTYRYEGAALRYLNQWIESIVLAKAGAVQEAGRDAAAPPGRAAESLPRTGALR